MSEDENFSPIPKKARLPAWLQRGRAWLVPSLCLACAWPALRACSPPCAAGVPNASILRQAKAKKAVGPLAGSSGANAANNGRRIEDVYQKKTQLEHILLRPDTYVGSVEKQHDKLWVHNGAKMEYRDVTYVPGLYKIFDEILVNAADHKVRDSSMKELRVTVDAATNTISVHNDGRGIPVHLHEGENCYVPELIFGHLLTSSNYDDAEKKVRCAM